MSLFCAWSIKEVSEKLSENGWWRQDPVRIRPDHVHLRKVLIESTGTLSMCGPPPVDGTLSLQTGNPTPLSQESPFLA